MTALSLKQQARLWAALRGHVERIIDTKFVSTDTMPEDIDQVGCSCVGLAISMQIAHTLERQKELRDELEFLDCVALALDAAIDVEAPTVTDDALRCANLLHGKEILVLLPWGQLVTSYRRSNLHLSREL